MKTALIPFKIDIVDYILLGLRCNNMHGESQILKKRVILSVNSTIDIDSAEDIVH